MGRIVSGMFRIVRPEQGSILLHTFYPYVIAYVDEFHFEKVKGSK